MGESGFIDGLVKIMLGWARWLTDMVWGGFQSSPADGGFLVWFGRSWPFIFVVLVIAGIVIDWLVWMVRWRPYWLWFRKKQIIYAEEGEIPLAEAEEERRRTEEEFSARWSRSFSARRKARSQESEEEDPFAENTLIPTAEDRKRAARKQTAQEQEDIFAPRKKSGYHVMFDDAQPARQHVMFEEEFEDPFAEDEEEENE